MAYSDMFPVAKIICGMCYFAFMVNMMLSSWVYYERGRITMWRECMVPNNSVIGECWFASENVPAFLIICRTFSVLESILFIPFVYSAVVWNECTRQPSFKWLAKSLSFKLILVLTGGMMLSACILFTLNYYNYYTESGEREDVKRGNAFYSTFFGGAVLLLFVIYFSIKYDTGLGKYIKSKLKIRGRARNIYNCNASTFEQE